MKIAKFISILGLVAMTGILLFAFTKGNFSVEGAKLIAMPWGIVSLVDLYTGFVLFSTWIVYREKSIVSAIIWVILMMVLGFFTASLYVFITLQNSGGNWQKFWLGKYWEKV